MIIAFHPSIKLLRISIFRSFDQNENDLQSISHFQVIEHDFFNTEKEYFNRITLKQLQQAAYSVSQKEKSTSLAEMFNIKLKFTVDCIKNWFSSNLKSRELDLDEKRNPRLENGWANYVFKAEHLFLENIYTEKQMKKIGIDNLKSIQKN